MPGIFKEESFIWIWMVEKEKETEIYKGWRENNAVDKQLKGIWSVV